MCTHVTTESRKKKTTPAGQCRTTNFGVLQATADTLKTLQTYSSNVGEGGVCGRWRAAQAFIIRVLAKKRSGFQLPVDFSVDLISSIWVPQESGVQVFVLRVKLFHCFKVSEFGILEFQRILGWVHFRSADHFIAINQAGGIRCDDDGNGSSLLSWFEFVKRSGSQLVCIFCTITNLTTLKSCQKRRVEIWKPFTTAFKRRCTLSNRHFIHVVARRGRF